MEGPVRAAAFLDRDGTIIEDRHYLADPAGVVLLPGAADAIGRLNSAGIPVIVVTNQSGIGRGLITQPQYQAVADRLESLLRAAGVRIDGTYYCPHHPDETSCVCRKPATGLFLQAARDHHLDLARSHFVGDRLRDVIPGLAFGGTGYLIDPEAGAGIHPLPAAVVPVRSLADAVKRMEQDSKFGIQDSGEA